ncbi:tRNA-specific adenosine deaminase [Aspergillus stella-maris]|uniref:tRNA-specific adenosine deaminase n=1 Tax=Aspergillus stella-maris TaxID=1810926 RepID=UPI003CCD6C77
MGDPEIESLPSRIADLVHAHFDGLPKRSKPIVRDDGTAEWIPMTGIVLVKGENTPSETLTCVAVTTGAKCLSASQIPNCDGLVLHDCHAEILAIRAFNFWLLSECRAFFQREKDIQTDRESNQDGSEGSSRPIPDSDERPSPYIRRRQKLEPVEDATTPPLEIQPGVSTYMYCTCAPCGDASMELLMAEQDDPTPWAIPEADPNTTAETTSALSGRGHFSRLGVVRRKPARADAESTKSKSCSDKLALRQVSSLLGHGASLLIAPTEDAYIKGLVMPEEEISKVGVERCFGRNGRMKPLNGQRWPVLNNGHIENDTGNGHDDSSNQRGFSYEYHPFDVLSIPNKQLASHWPFRKPKASDSVSEENATAQSKKRKPGTISAVWVRAPTETSESKSTSSTAAAPIDNGAKNLPVLRGSKTGLFESIVNGVRQGHKASAPGLRGASALSRARLHQAWSESYLAGSQNSLQAGPESSSNQGETNELWGADAKTAKDSSTYREFKNIQTGNGARRRALQAAKEVLGDWVPNEGDEDWGWNATAGGLGLVDAQGHPIENPKAKKRKR